MTSDRRQDGALYQPLAGDHVLAGRPAEHPLGHQARSALVTGRGQGGAVDVRRDPHQLRRPGQTI